MPQICGRCAKVRLEDDDEFTAYLMKEHDIAMKKEGDVGAGVMDASAQGGSGANTGASGQTLGGGGGDKDDSCPMETDEDEDTFPGLSQGSQG